MQKTKLVFLSFPILFFYSLAIALEPPPAPSVIVSASGTDVEYIKFINILNNSAIYSNVTNKILNGSGNKSLLPTKQASLLEKIMDQISFFDLYFQKSLSVSGIKNLNLDLHFLPTTNTASSSSIIPENARLSINSLTDEIKSITNANIQFKKTQDFYSTASLHSIRQSQLAALKFRTQLHLVTAATVASTPGHWLMASYSPISMGTQVKVTDSDKKFVTTFLFPAYDYIKLFKSYFSGTENQNTDVVRVEFIKNIDQPHLLDMAISFGSLTESNLTSVYTLDIDNLKNPEQRQSITKSNLALTANTGFNISQYLQLDNPKATETLNNLINALDIFDIKFVFHKIYFELDRLPIHNASFTYLENPENQNNLNLFLNSDIGFDIKNMKFNPAKSDYNIMFSFKPEFKAKLQNSSWWNVQDNIQKELLSMICPNDTKSKGDISNCRFSMKDFNTKITNAFSSPVVQTYFDGIRLSTANQLQQAERIAEKTLQNLMADFVEKFRETSTKTQKAK